MIFRDAIRPDIENYPIYLRTYYADPDNQYWNKTHQATEDKDLFIFRKGHGVDTILDFAPDDKIRFVDFRGTFSDLTFEVDTTAQTITIRYDGSVNPITLRNAAALIDPDGTSLLTAANFHFVQDTTRGVVLEGGLGDDILRGGKGDDTLYGGGWGNSEMYGGPGDDILRGGYDDDILRGGKGDDILKGARGNDILIGGAGNDHLHFTEGESEMYGGEGNDLLEASYGKNALYGGKGKDILESGHGEDALYGGKGDDILDSCGGDSELYGGRGDDILEVSWGDNHLVGGKGDDTLVSGWGADTFVFREGDGHDTIVDFGFGYGGSDSDDIVGLKSERRARKAAKANGEVDRIELHLNLPATTTEPEAFAGLRIKAREDTTVIRYGEAGDTITLEYESKKMSPLTLDDFDFVFVG